jgi:hypothetical protein
MIGFQKDIKSYLPRFGNLGKSFFNKNFKKMGKVNPEVAELFTNGVFCRWSFLPLKFCHMEIQFVEGTRNRATWIPRQYNSYYVRPVCCVVSSPPLSSCRRNLYCYLLSVCGFSRFGTRPGGSPVSHPRFV